MSFFDVIRHKAKEKSKKIVLPEGNDGRILAASSYLLENRIVKLVLVGKEEIRKKITSRNKDDLEIIDPESFSGLDTFAETYYQLRKHKGVSRNDARKDVREDYVLFSALLVRSGVADGFVAGASHTSTNVLRFALRCLPRDEAVGTVSGAFLIEISVKPEYGENGILLFADCAVNPVPNSHQLSSIALASAKTFRQLIGVTPRVAFLSYSSKGSAKGPSVEKIREALREVQEKEPALIVDGELQVDSAIVPEVAERKCPQSKVAGHANVLIFPDLDAGNISYKLVQRVAQARAVGPVIQGFTKSCSDLSRGCEIDDIIDAAAVTALRADILA